MSGAHAKWSPAARLQASDSMKRWWNTRGAEQRFAHGQSRARQHDNTLCFTVADCRLEERRRRYLSSQVWTRYRLQPEDEARLYEQQRGLCALCAEPLGFAYDIDHHHETEIVRGLLHRTCNLRAASVLERFGELGVAYTIITPVDLFLRNAALNEGAVTT